MGGERSGGGGGTAGAGRRRAGAGYGPGKVNAAISKDSLGTVEQPGGAEGASGGGLAKRDQTDSARKRKTTIRSFLLGTLPLSLGGPPSDTSLG